MSPLGSGTSTVIFFLCKVKFLEFKIVTDLKFSVTDVPCLMQVKMVGGYPKAIVPSPTILGLWVELAQHSPTITHPLSRSESPWRSEWMSGVANPIRVGTSMGTFYFQ